MGHRCLKRLHALVFRQGAKLRVVSNDAMDGKGNPHTILAYTETFINGIT